MPYIYIPEEQWEEFLKILVTELPENSKLKKLAECESPFERD